jgi:hypothetical protein
VFDDGRHRDGRPDDGVFGATIATGPTKGHHEIQVAATLPASLGGGTIESLGEFETWTVEDLLTLPGSVCPQ